MRARVHALFLLALILSLTAFPSAALAARPPTLAPRQGLTIVTMRLGISAGPKIEGLMLGTDRRALERVMPELTLATGELGVRIDSVSVGRGFWSEDSKVESENDLDLVVTGLRENILALGATLGLIWRQSTVLAWEMTVVGETLTAILPLGDGVTRLNDATFEALAKVLTDGGHIKYAASESLLFVAHTGDDSDDQFRVRMAQAKGILDGAGITTSTLVFGQAEMTVLNQDNYQQYIDGAVHGKAA